MIKLIEVHISYGTRPILDGMSWMLGDNDRAGLVGENGSGKSTLLKILAGLQEVDHGKVEVSKGLTIGYLPQEGATHSGRTLKEEAASALGPVLAIKAESAEIEKRLTQGGLPADEQAALVQKLALLNDRFNHLGGYELDAKVGKVLAGLGFSEAQHGRLVESFSGGWQMRIALAKILLAQPDVLLLDEPTNHLDIEARNWLEGFLRETPCSYLIVSHDRYFLDVTIDRIVEVERGRLTDYRGNYSRYVTEKEKRVNLAQIAYDRQQEEIQKLKGFINKYKADKKRAGQAQARQKRLEKMELLEAPINSRPIKFKFPDPPRGPGEMARLCGVCKSYGQHVVLGNVDLLITRGEKAAVVGHNGAGKSTLLDIIAGKKKFGPGKRIESDGVSIAYFGQEASDDLDPADTVLEAVSRGAPFDMYPRLRSLLGAFLFSGEDVDKKVSVLSGGEKSRLALARLLLKPANLLILDEPTNHLDLRAKEVLMEAFSAYAGALIFVAHDRYFLEGLPDRVIEVRDRHVTSYQGDYQDYLYALEREGRAEDAGMSHADKTPRGLARTGSGPMLQNAGSAAKAGKSGGNGDGALSKEERIRRREQEKRRQRAQQKKKRTLADLEGMIVATEERIERLEARMSEPGVATDYMKLNELGQEREELSRDLESLLGRWEELGSRMETPDEPE
ncbi:MAG TPA: ABC-F family ATP-binding cassette domain-containing protein [bacterium]|nr:ABC-F family ATP-binding cassette domain-containing protein [bacterium]